MMVYFQVIRYLRKIVLIVTAADRENILCILWVNVMRNIEIYFIIFFQMTLLDNLIISTGNKNIGTRRLIVMV